MNLINNNPYRILDLPITAKEKEIARQFNILATYAEMGKTKLFDTDYPFLSPVDRTSHSIEEAKKQIEQEDGKLLNSLFWFWKSNSVDELAFDLLKDGNTAKAIDIWEKAVLANKNKVYKPVTLYENLIASSSHFDDTDDESHLLKKNGDEYIVERKKKESYSIPTAFCDLDFDSNWTIECDSRWISGIDNNGYGIVLGREKGSYYTFQIAANGYYRFDKYAEWSFNEMIPWKECPYVKKWGTNIFKIKKIENQLSLYINEISVETIQIETFFGKYFGFKVTSNQRISFRNFKFSKLVEDETYGEGLNISQKNVSSLKNLSTLYLGLSVASTKGTFKLQYFKKGVALAKSFFENGNIEDYSKLIAGERYNYKSEKALHFYINEIIDSLKNYLGKTDGISKSEFITSFSTYPVEVKQFLDNKFIAKEIQNIDKEIDTAQTKRRASAGEAIQTGKTLVNNTTADIKYLKDILGEANYQYQTIADKLSLAIIQCGIDAFNFCKTVNGEIDYAKAIKNEEDFLHEYEYALSLAATQRTKERAKENLDTCKEYIKNKHLYNCWFCGSNPPENSSKFEITIYKETYRSYFPRRVQFSYVPVGIPRCSHCQKTHSEGSDKTGYALFGGLVVGAIVGGLADGHWFIGLLIGGFIGWLIGTSLKSQHLSKTGIKDTSQSTIRNYPVLNQMLKEGWQFSKPTA